MVTLGLGARRAIAQASIAMGPAHTARGRNSWQFTEEDVVVAGDDRHGMLITRLHALLAEVLRVAGTDFAGVGVMVAANPDSLPIAPLTANGEHQVGGTARDVLATVSRVGSRHHDGFHVLTPDLRILLLSQYLAAPILPGALLGSPRGSGARYAAALFGSAVPGVLATAVATTNYGVAVFEGGMEVELNP